MTTLVHNGTRTSVMAAESMKGSAASLRLQILDAIRCAGIHGLTRDEITVRTRIPPNTVRPSVVELLKRKLIEPSDEIRHTASGRRAEVLVARCP